MLASEFDSDRFTSTSGGTMIIMLAIIALLVPLKKNVSMQKPRSILVPNTLAKSRGGNILIRKIGNGSLVLKLQQYE